MKWFNNRDMKKDCDNLFEIAWVALELLVKIMTAPNGTSSHIFCQCMIQLLILGMCWVARGRWWKTGHCWLSCMHEFYLHKKFDVRKKPKGALMSAFNILILHFLFLSQEIRNTEKFGFYVSSRDILRPIKCTSFQIHLNCSFAWNIPFRSSMMSLIYSINSIGPRHSFFYCRLQIGAFIVLSKLT